MPRARAGQSEMGRLAAVHRNGRRSSALPANCLLRAERCDLRAGAARETGRRGLARAGGSSAAGGRAVVVVGGSGGGGGGGRQRSSSNAQRWWPWRGFALVFSSSSALVLACTLLSSGLAPPLALHSTQ